MAAIVDPPETAALTELQLEQLENVATPIPTVSDLIALVDGSLPTLQIDITDPPSPAIARHGAVSATGANADAAIQALGPRVAAVLRAVVVPIDPGTPEGP